jgi:transcriptional regulator of acetoin/glycerol metabolism
MTDVLRGRDTDARPGPFEAWVADYRCGRYTEVVRAWLASRPACAAELASDAAAQEAVGWSLALTKQWEPYRLYRNDLVQHDGSESRLALVAVLDAWHAIHEGRYDACLHAVRSVRAHLLQPGSQARAVAWALKVEGVALFRMGRYHEAEALVRRALEIFQLAGESLDVAHCATNLGLVLNALGEHRAARDELRRALDVLGRAGAADERLALAGVNLAVVELHLGEVAAARELFQSALATFEALDLRSERITALNGLGHCARVAGDFAGAAAHYEAALRLTDTSLARQIGLGHEFLGQIEHDRGRHARAERHYDRAREVAADIAPDGDLMLEVSWRLAELLCDTGRAAAAREHVERAEALCGASRERRELGCVQRARARLLAAEGDEGARATFETARATLVEAGRHFEAALTLLAHARFESERGEWAVAAEKLAGARRLFAELCPASAWVQKVDRLLAGCGPARPAADGARPPERYGFWTHDADLVQMLDDLPLAAATRHPVLIEGETGTGKELLARAVHACSGRTGAFVAVNCAAVPRDLFESELFGHVRGAFSGALLDKPGLLEQAHLGTLLLDEVGDMPLDLQVKLLRVLDDGLVRRLGDTRERPVEVKVVAATNRPLAAAVAVGGFRADLYHRLAVHHLEIKPLRERPEDILLLAEVFVRKEGLADRVQLDGSLQAELQARPWPGNARELRNVLLRVGTTRRRAPAFGAAAVDAASLRTARSAHERRLIEATLAAAHGNVGEAARSLRLHVTTLRRKMRALGVEPRRD